MGALSYRFDGQREGVCLFLDCICCQIMNLYSTVFRMSVSVENVQGMKMRLSCTCNLPSMDCMYDEAFCTCGRYQEALGLARD